MSPAPRDHLVVIGAMGSGKTTLATELAERLSRPLYDSDAQLAVWGLDARTLLQAAGRDALHRAEADALRDGLASPRPAVIAAAAGVIDDDDACRAIEGAGFVIYLRAEIPTLAKRIGSGEDRPVSTNPVEDLERLDPPRRVRSAELADLVIDVDGLDSEEVLERALAALLREVTVSLGERSYPVRIGPGVRASLNELLPKAAKRVAIVTQSGIGYELEVDRESKVFTIGDGESAKSMSTIEALSEGFAEFGLTRADVVVALGGGVVTDAAGFAAACYHRGTAYINVATTLLGQIDAAVGGKTAVNIPQGKNLVGAFWQPHAVLCDTDTLSTLPEREWRSGLGEMAKYAFLGVDDLDRLPLVEQVAACVRLKAEVVSEDEREGDRRMLLNYGHTLAHALEAAGFADGPGRDGIDLRHGEAVAIGIAFAARLANLLGRIDEARIERHLEVLAAYGLPAEIPAGVDVEEMLVLMSRDKKATNGLTFVLDGPSGVEVVREVSPYSIRVAFERSGPGSAGA